MKTNKQQTEQKTKEIQQLLPVILRLQTNFTYAPPEVKKAPERKEAKMRVLLPV